MPDKSQIFKLIVEGLNNIDEINRSLQENQEHLRSMDNADITNKEYFYRLPRFKELNFEIPGAAGEYINSLRKNALEYYRQPNKAYAPLDRVNEAVLKDKLCEEEGQLLEKKQSHLPELS